MPRHDEFKQLLRKSGYKTTSSRIGILEAFKKSRSPLSAQEILEQLPRGFDQTTVYRTLKSLKEKGIIKQIDLRHNHAHYELTNLAEHHHLICLQCGRVEDVNHCGVENMESAVLRSAKHFAEIKQHALEFYGICKSCSRKGQGDNKN